MRSRNTDGIFFSFIIFLLFFPVPTARTIGTTFSSDVGVRRLSETGYVVAVDTIAATSSGNELPFWLHSNRWDTRRTDERQVGANLFYTQRIDFFNNNLIFDWELFLSSIGTNVDQLSHVNRAFFRIGYNELVFAGGILPVEKGMQNGEISSGSLVLSRNARPIPRIYLGFPRFTDVPFTEGLIQVKGSISHGWLEDDRTVSSPWLHEKDAYVRIHDPFGWGLSVYRGLIHEVIWAGTNQDGTTRPNSWNDFFRVFRSSGGGDDASLSEQQNALGDTIGMWDLGIIVDRQKFSMSIYHQHMFEDGSGYRLGSGARWGERFLRLRDGLSGISIYRPGRPLIKAITYEYLDTRHQSGPGWHGTTGGWDNYFEHGQYRTGWTYGGRVLGSPLVSVSGTGEILEFIHTRVLAHHVGIKGYLNERTFYRSLVTYSRNFGTYRRNVPVDERKTLTDVNHPYYDPTGGQIRGDRVFREGLTQWAILFETGVDRNLFGVESLFGALSLGIDLGELRTESVGALLSIGWSYGS